LLGHTGRGHGLGLFRRLLLCGLPRHPGGCVQAQQAGTPATNAAAATTGPHAGEGVLKGAGRERERWRQTTVAESLRRLPLRQPRFETLSGLPLEDVYVPDGAANPGEPGQYPFTRGIHASMYRGRLWTMR